MKNICQKNKDFLRAFFLDFGRLWALRVLRVWASFWLKKSIFFALCLKFQFVIDFGAFWKGLGRVWGGFGEGLGKVWGGFGEGLGRFWG